MFQIVSFGKDSLVGWDCLFMDTDFHFLTREDGTTTSKSGSIHIGDNNWFGCCCKVLKNTSTTNDITIAANTLLTGNYTDGGDSKSVIGNDSRVRVIKTGLWRNPRNYT